MAWPDDVAVQAETWHRVHDVVGRTVKGSDQDAWLAAGVVDAACASLMRHATDAAVAEWTCTSLWRLCYRHAPSQARAGEAGIAPALVAVLTANPESVPVVGNAITAMNVMLQLPANVSRVAAAGGRAALAQVRAAHLGLHENVCNAMRSEDVV